VTVRATREYKTVLMGQQNVTPAGLLVVTIVKGLQAIETVLHEQRYEIVPAENSRMSKHGHPTY
jgi:hypothetical protein